MLKRENFCFELHRYSPSTYVVEPGHLVGLGVRQDEALEVDVGALLDVVGVERGAHLEGDDGHVCERFRFIIKIASYSRSTASTCAQHHKRWKFEWKRKHKALQK